jgi:predicted nicotinamide N-methyase
MPDAPQLDSRAAEMSEWIAARVEFFLAHTVCCATPAVPEITLRLGREAVPLWDAIERSFGQTAAAAPPYWGFAWPGGQAVARHVLDHPQLVAGRRVLDFASGCGISAIAAARAAALRVVAHDIDPFAVIAISMNADANRVAVEASAVDLLRDDACFDCSGIDLVLVGDAFYDGGFAARATAFLLRCRRAGCTVLIGDPGRAALPRELLVKRAEYVVPVAAENQYTAAATREAHDNVLATVWELDAAKAAATLAG